MIGRCLRWLQRWDPRSPRPTTLTTPVAGAVATTASPAVTPPMPEVRGHADGWLRVLPAQDLLTLVHAGRALDAMWRQSRLSQAVFNRDLQPALQRYAEFVQLMPASESHHHAHVGGLLSHTLEMTLAAMTWRNGHFFPEGVGVEEMDAQRDEWTYVVFFAALLHDIGKIMTDLRVSWRTADMDAALRWVPMSGPLTAMVQSRSGAEYLVEFTPKSARDYQAHARLSAILLQQVAPSSALSFMARRPQAFEALTQYLSGADKHSLLAQLVRRADQSSTMQALAHGSRERFATSSAVALIDLLMQALREMLKAGTVLPLNRSGAAGWVYDGAMWLVAKRLADAVRQHIRQHQPDESVPGDNKNDRLFDTWQEYGCITANPHTAQAIWYVQVHGAGASSDADPDSGQQEEGGYSHSLTVLRFPLEKVFDDPAQYPAAMRGRIEVLAKRAATPAPAQAAPEAPLTQPESDTEHGRSTPPEAKASGAAAARPKYDKSGATTLRAPAFKKPSAKPAAPVSAPAPAPVPPQGQGTSPHGSPHGSSVRSKTTDAPHTKPANPAATPAEPPLDKWLDFEDDAAMFRDMPKLPERAPAAPATPSTPLARKAPEEPTRAPATSPAVTPKVGPAVKPKASREAAPNDSTGHQAAPTPSPAHAPSPPSTTERPALPVLPSLPVSRPLLARELPPEVAARTSPPRLQSTPVLLSPFLPDLPHETGKHVEPSASAMAFMQWLQQGLAQRSLKYNETGALVHFTAEGMALVSPLVFKTYVADEEDAHSDAEANGQALQIQREVIKAGWHLMGPGKTNILRYEVIGRGNAPVGKLSAVVLTRPERWVMPVPPINPVLKLA